MALTPQQKAKVLDYIHKSFAGASPTDIVIALFDTIFMDNASKKAWILSRIDIVKQNIQQLRNNVDAQAIQDKAALDAELTGIGGIETDI